LLAGAERPQKEGAIPVHFAMDQEGFYIARDASQTATGCGMRKISAVLTNPEIALQRPHWLAGVGGFELTNVASKIDL
jgi:hypothetical protein